MRWEPSKMGMKGARRRTLRGPRRESARNSMLRRITLEALESRTLLDATLPAPTVVANSQIEYHGRRRGTRAVRRLPSTSTTRTSWRRSGCATIPSWRRGSRSSWRCRSPTMPGIHGRPPRRYRSSPNPNTTGPTVPFAQATDPSVAFDRNDHIYVLTDQNTTDNSVGALVLDTYDFSGDTPSAAGVEQCGVRVGRRRPRADADDGGRRQRLLVQRRQLDRADRDADRPDCRRRLRRLDEQRHAVCQRSSAVRVIQSEPDPDHRVVRWGKHLRRRSRSSTATATSIRAR